MTCATNGVPSRGWCALAAILLLCGMVDAVAQAPAPIPAKSPTSPPAANAPAQAGIGAPTPGVPPVTPATPKPATEPVAPATPDTAGVPDAPKPTPATETAAPEETSEGLSPERSAALTAALDTLAASEDPVAAELTAREVLDSQVTGAAWHGFYLAYFKERGFAPGHAAFWQAAIANGAADAAAYAQASCRFALEAASAALRASPANFDALGRALQWLDQTAFWLGPERLAPVAEALRDTFVQPLDLRPLLLVDESADPATVQMALQTALSMSNLIAPAGLVKHVLLPAAAREFYAQRGVFVFDNGVLDPTQLQSLDSLFASIPPPLHQVIAVIVPEGMRTGSEQLNLVSAKQIIDISAMPLDLLSDPAEFIPRAAQPIAPEFTLGAATQLLRAIQRVQFSARPDLAMRRDQLLERTGTRRERYLRRSVMPIVYLENPDELLPLTGYLWMIDSEAAFYQAMELLKLRENEALDAILLLADVLSGGGNSTLLFRTDPLGHVTSQETALRRTVIGPDMAFVTAVGVAGQLWAFDLNEMGGVMRYYRNASPEDGF